MCLVLCLTVSVISTAAASDGGSWGWLSAGNISAVAKVAGPVIQVVQKTWDKESLLGIMQGRIAVPDTAVNDALAQQLPAGGPVKALSITSRENGRLDIHADTEKIGRVEISGTVDAFVHNGDASYMTYTVKDKELKDHNILSWAFSRLSLSMMQKLTGPVSISDDLPVSLKGNSVTVDFHQILKQSDLGQTSFYGYNLLDALRIESATPHDGYIEFKTALNIPDEAKALLLKLL